jgi:hypothetical protein
MNHEEFMNALKGIDFKELVNAYLEANIGKTVNFENEFNLGDVEIIDNVDSMLYFFISQNK